MTPYEKADRLVYSFYQKVYDIQKARKCATILVDEIIEVIGSFGYACMFDDFETNKTVYNMDVDPEKYWVEVKNEIQKL